MNQPLNIRPRREASTFVQRLAHAKLARAEAGDYLRPGDRLRLEDRTTLRFAGTFDGAWLLCERPWLARMGSWIRWGGKPYRYQYIAAVRITHVNGLRVAFGGPRP